MDFPGSFGRGASHNARESTFPFYDYFIGFPALATPLIRSISSREETFFRGVSMPQSRR